MIHIYSLLVFLFSPFLLLVFIWKYGLRKTLAGLPERLGMGAGPGGKKFPKGWLWVHAASVGEVKAAESFLKAMPARFPGRGRLLTTTTVAGKELAEKSGLAECVRLAPVDLPFCLNRLMDRWLPAAVVLVETELWPNWMGGLARKGVPAVVVNGRVSDRAFPRYRFLRSFWDPLLGSLARVGVQSPAHASRFLQLGARPDAVVITGNLKADVPLPDLTRRDEMRTRFGFFPSDVLWVCGSTHPGEEEALADILSALRSEGRDVKMILAPRRVERAKEIGVMLSSKGLPFLLRSSPASNPRPPAPVLVLDTLGELSDAYGAASLAFVGGSLVSRGGQNPLEPARWEVPVLFGPHMENFREMADLFAAQGAGAPAADAAGLAAEVRSLLDDPARTELRARAARRLAESQRGALEASLALLSEALNRPPTEGSCCHG